MRKKSKRARRAYDDPAYALWRKLVYERDHFSCRLCGSSDRIQAHHIRRYADHPKLRLCLGNGVTLCAACHKKVTGREATYEVIFDRMLGKHYKESDGTE